jgi:hypothetical protein
LADEASFAMAGKPQLAAHGLTTTGRGVNLTVKNRFRAEIWTLRGNSRVTFDYLQFAFNSTV